ncbi:hypothetical protein JHK86_014173 [Glycine max]|nr:hypothetical protein JHK86_014173 [Glycine max]
MKVDRLLVDYLEASLEARHCCDTILQAIHQTRFAYARVTNVVVKLSQTTSVTYIHDRYMTLLRMLLSKKRKIQRILTIKRVCKKVGGIGLIVSPSVLLAALLVFAFHSVIGFNTTTNSCMKLCEQLDVAAKRVYVVINELDTMSRTIKRLDDEVEHWREIADICVKNYCKCEILKRIVKEFQDNKSN